MREPGPVEAPKPRLLDRVRLAIRARHYSRRTEKAYVDWIKRYIFFHSKRHPIGMGAAKVTEFLTHLAVQGKVAASTQNQALSSWCAPSPRSGCPSSSRARKSGSFSVGLTACPA